MFESVSLFLFSYEKVVNEINKFIMTVNTETLVKYIRQLFDAMKLYTPLEAFGNSTQYTHIRVKFDISQLQSWNGYVAKYVIQ